MLNTINKQALAYANLIQLGTDMIAATGSSGKITGRISTQDGISEIISARLQMTLNKKAEVQDDK